MSEAEKPETPSCPTCRDYGWVNPATATNRGADEFLDRKFRADCPACATAAPGVYRLTESDLFRLAGAISVPFMRDNPDYVMPTEELNEIIRDFVSGEEEKEQTMDAPKTMKITAEVFVEIGEDDDPETVAARMDRGLYEALHHFPDAEIVGAEVAGMIEATPEEAARYREDD